MNEFTRSFNLFRLVEDALAELGDVGRVRRVVPIAWPIQEIEHSLRIRLEESINLVERHVLEAIARFGPVSEADLCEWMGLEPAVLQHIIALLERFPGVISRESGLFVATEGTLARCAEERWGREVVQKVAFLVNGPTGRLAPTAVNNLPPWYQLRMEFDGNSGLITDRSGKELDQVFWVSASQSDAYQELSMLAQGVDSKVRSEVGVPDGTFAMESAHGKGIGVRWILALGILEEDGQFVVRPAGLPEMLLLALSKEQLTDFESLLRRGERNGSGLFNLREDKRSEKEIPADWEEYAQSEPVGSKLTIRLRNPAFFEHWQPTRGENVGANRSASAESLPAFPLSLRIAMGRPYMWHQYFFTIRKILPGDLATAGVMLKQRAMMDLERITDSAPTSFDLPSWWKSEQEKIASSWPESVRPPEMPLRDLLKVARRSSNPDVVDLVMENM